MMDPDEGFYLPHCSPTRPLQLHKQTSQLVAAKGNARLGDNNPFKSKVQPTKVDYPPRSSSLVKSHTSNKSHNRQLSNNSAQSAISQHRDKSITSAGTSGHLSSGTTAQSTVSSAKEQSIADSSGLIGDFVPVLSPKMAVPRRVSDEKGELQYEFRVEPAPTQRRQGGGSIVDSPDLYEIVTASRNPYEFEPATPHPNNGNNGRMTQFGDFIDSSIMASTPTNLDKNARFEHAAAFTSERPNSLHIPTPKLRPIPRCDSSPVVSSPLMFTVRQCAPIRHEKVQVASPLNVSYYDDYNDIKDEQSISPTYPTTRGRSSPPKPIRPFERNASPRRDIYNQARPSTSHDDHQNSNRQARPSTSQDTYSQDTHRQVLASARQPSYDQSNPSIRQNDYRPRSPVRVPPRQSEDSYRNDRYATRSPTKILADVNEYDEVERPRHISPPAVRKRARSPMKKMFGENGWLGKSPSEAHQAQFQVRRESTSQRPSMLGRLKSKFEELAEMADLSPSHGLRPMKEKHPKISVLTVSLSPPEQARISMEVELMLVHTANRFLMNQFSQGRVAVESIKKIIDMWKSKGRPIVIEFMYDQATQRDLVVANQHNFRFHGDRAGDNTRITSFLYTWKQIASLMAIRTFCNADTVMLKMLFDIEQILECLGAPEPLMLRLQQIRISSNELMRLKRQSNESNPNTMTASYGHDLPWGSRESGTGSVGSIRDRSMNDPYGGMKLVPDQYTEK